MSTSRGIFENFPNQSPPSGSASASPFGIAAEDKPAQPASAQDPKRESPFSVVSDDRSQDEKSTRIPERRKHTDSPFQISEPQGFGFEAPPQSPQALRASPFEAAPAALSVSRRASPLFPTRIRWLASAGSCTPGRSPGIRPSSPARRSTGLVFRRNGIGFVFHQAA